VLYEKLAEPVPVNAAALGAKQRDGAVSRILEELESRAFGAALAAWALNAEGGGIVLTRGAAFAILTVIHVLSRLSSADCWACRWVLVMTPCERCLDPGPSRGSCFLSLTRFRTLRLVRGEFGGMLLGQLVDDAAHGIGTAAAVNGSIGRYDSALTGEEMKCMGVKFVLVHEGRFSCYEAPTSPHLAMFWVKSEHTK
jgi:hypothetical protein